MTTTPTEQDIRIAICHGDERTLGKWLRAAIDQRDQLQQQAEIHAQEARTANATIHEIYQVCTGATGEPGSWHGAEPVRQVVNELREAKQALRDVRPEIDSLIAGLYRSHVNPSDGIVHDEDVAHEIAQITKLHERIEMLIGGRGAVMTDGRQYQAGESRSKIGQVDHDFERTVEGMDEMTVLSMYYAQRNRAVSAEERAERKAALHSDASVELQRAEAECERLREALRNVQYVCRDEVRDYFEKVKQVDSMCDIALATPPPEGESLWERSKTFGHDFVYEGQDDAPDTPERGDSLTALNELVAIASAAVGDKPAAVEKLDERKRIIRQALTASGVPYAPERVRALPAEWRGCVDQHGAYLSEVAANQRTPEDPGVAVYFYWQGTQHALACDRWDRVVDNLQALRKSIEAMRGLDRWGASGILERAFSGFARLDAPTHDWRTVLGVAGTPPWEEIWKAHKHRRRETHPDLGGDPQSFHRVEQAFEAAKLEYGL